MKFNIFRDKYTPTEGEIERLDQLIVRNQEIDAIKKQPGWRVLESDLLKILQSMSDIRHKSNRSEENRRGFCEGIEYIFSRIRSYKRSAEYAEQKLRKYDG